MSHDRLAETQRRELTALADWLRERTPPDDPGLVALDWARARLAAVKAERDSYAAQYDESVKETADALTTVQVLSEDIVALAAERDTAVAEADELRAVNESVRVCAAHTSEIRGAGCAVCELEQIGGERDAAVAALRGSRELLDAPFATWEPEPPAWLAAVIETLDAALTRAALEGAAQVGQPFEYSRETLMATEAERDEALAALRDALKPMWGALTILRLLRIQQEERGDGGYAIVTPHDIAVLEVAHRNAALVVDPGAAAEGASE